MAQHNKADLLNLTTAALMDCGFEEKSEPIATLFVEEGTISQTCQDVSHVRRDIANKYGESALSDDTLNEIILDICNNAIVDIQNYHKHNESVSDWVKRCNDTLAKYGFETDYDYCHTCEKPTPHDWFQVALLPNMKIHRCVDCQHRQNT